MMIEHSVQRRSELLWFIGRNAQGQWVVRDEDAQTGGVFINRRDAIRFALFESCDRPSAVLMLPGVVQTSLSPNLSDFSKQQLSAKRTELAA